MMNVDHKRVKLPWQSNKIVKPYERKTEHDNSGFYNSSSWRKLSKLNLKEEPLCEACKSVGLKVIAKVSDHLIPINSGGSRLDRRNLMSLCAGCHDCKSGKERHKSPLIEAQMVDNELIPVNREEIFKVLNG